jgi:zinc transport system substrate-binding protein
MFGSLIYADKLNIITSIAPQKTFIKAIGKDKVKVTVMVKQGQSPHTYEPKPSQMINISKAIAYFTIGVEFEHNWLSKFSSLNKNMLIIDSA